MSSFTLKEYVESALTYRYSQEYFETYQECYQLKLTNLAIDAYNSTRYKNIIDLMEAANESNAATLENNKEGLISRIWNKIKKLWETIVKAIKGFFEKIGEWFSKTFLKRVGAVEAILNNDTVEEKLKRNEESMMESFIRVSQNYLNEQSEIDQKYTEYYLPDPKKITIAHTELIQLINSYRGEFNSHDDVDYLLNSLNIIYWNGKIQIPDNIPEATKLLRFFNDISEINRLLSESNRSGGQKNYERISENILRSLLDIKEYKALLSEGNGKVEVTFDKNWFDKNNLVLKNAREHELLVKAIEPNIDGSKFFELLTIFNELNASFIQFYSNLTRLLNNQLVYINNITNLIVGKNNIKK